MKFEQKVGPIPALTLSGWPKFPNHVFMTITVDSLNSSSASSQKTHRDDDEDSPGVLQVIYGDLLHGLLDRDGVVGVVHSVFPLLAWGPDMTCPGSPTFVSAFHD